MTRLLSYALLVIFVLDHVAGGLLHRHEIRGAAALAGQAVVAGAAGPAETGAPDHCWLCALMAHGTKVVCSTAVSSGHEPAFSVPLAVPATEPLLSLPARRPSQRAPPLA